MQIAWKKLEIVLLFFLTTYAQTKKRRIGAKNDS